MTTPSTVTTSPYFEEIVQLLKGGTPYRRAHDTLAEKYGADAVPSASAIGRFRRHLFPNAAARQDNLRLLDQMVRAQRRRVARLWKRDDADAAPQLDAALRTLLGYLRERRRLGLAPDSPAEQPDASAGQPPAASADLATREEVQELLDLMERHRARFAPLDSQAYQEEASA